MERLVPIRRENAQILILVKAYPRPSVTYGETDCVAGLYEGREWVRLYPVLFRGLPVHQQFSKWQWITCTLTKSRRDSRTESWEPDHDGLTVGSTISSQGHGWSSRLRYLSNIPNDTIEGLQEDPRRSLGWVHPHEVRRFFYRSDTSQWPSHLQLQQLSFLGTPNEPIEKIPYTFYADFTCSEPCRGHRLSIVDWEIYSLYRNTRDPEKVIQKLNTLHQSCALSFFVGTSLRHHARRVYMIIGLFYPPKIVPQVFL